MADRLSALDASFLHLEEQTNALHVGSVMVFKAPAGGLDIAEFIAHVRSRIALVPRYRCRLRTIPGRIANPVWVDSEHFDLSYHVRRSAVPRPGTMEQLHELVARIMPRRLDRRRPLWELYVVEGLAGGRIALITKTHPAMIDGVRAVDLGHVVLDTEPRNAASPSDTWRPSREPSRVELVTGAVMDNLRTPSSVVDTVRASARQLNVGRTLTQLVNAARTATRVAPASPLNGRKTTEHRRFATAAVDLELLRKVRDKHAAGAWRRTDEDGADDVARVTINDVVLAILAGAIRHWLLMREWPVTATSLIRALSPVSVQLAPEDEPQRLSTPVDAQLVDLPVGESNPSMRLQRIAFQMAPHGDSERAVPAQSLMGLRGFAPPTIHALGIRVAQDWSNRLFNLVVTNVPGPQHTLYARRMMMEEAYPVIPVMSQHAMAVGVTSYAGQVFFGLNADRDQMWDLESFVDCLHESIDELAGTIG